MTQWPQSQDCPESENFVHHLTRHMKDASSSFNEIFNGTVMPQLVLLIRAFPLKVIHVGHRREFLAGVLDSLSLPMSLYNPNF